MKFSKIIKYLLVLILFCLTPREAVAKEYIFQSESNNAYHKAQTLTYKHDLVYIYGVLGEGKETVDYYALTFNEYVPQVSIALLVPPKFSKTFRPKLIFVDPNAVGMVGKIPFGFPLNVGGRVYGWEGQTEITETDETVFETLVTGPRFVRDVSQSRYILAVFDPEGRGGKYVIKIGSREKAMTILDELKNLWVLVRIKLGIY